MSRKRRSAGLLGLALAIGLASPASADPPAHVPGGPCLEGEQQVQQGSVPSYEEVVRQLDSTERSSQGAVQVRSAGRSGEGRELLYATVGNGPTAFWLQARIHGNELHSTEAVLQILKYLASSGDPVATRVREQLTVIVIPRPGSATWSGTGPASSVPPSTPCSPTPASTS
jgi:hypothetical protein